MDLRKLRHAAILAEEGTFARAARRLNLTQPALTRSVQALEASIGLRLFDRTGAGARPTVDGERILDHARTLLRQEASLRSEATLLARGETGRVAFGVGPMLTPVLGTVLTPIFAAGAQLDLRVEVKAIHVLEDLLLDGRIDFFIADTHLALANPELQVEQARNIPAGLYVRSGHPLAGQAEVTPADLTAFPMASPELGPAAGRFSPLHTITCEDCASLKQIVLGSDTVMVGMSLSVEPDFSAGRMIRLSGEALLVERSRVGLVRRASRTLSAGARRIAAGFDEVLAAHAA